MPALTEPSTSSKIWSLFTAIERRSALILLGLMLIGMVLEMLGIGLVVPAIALLTQPDFARNYPAFLPLLNALGNPSQQSLVIGGMLGLVGIYVVKASFLSFLAWWEMRFAYDFQTQLSQRLFTTYLRQPYIFHLQRNTAQLINNTINEVQQFWLLVLSPGMSALTEGLALLGIGGLLIAVEPLGAMIVILVLGGSTWSLHRWSRAHIIRWGEIRQRHDTLRMQHLQQGLGGAKDVKLLGREKDFLAQYHAHSVQSARMGQFQSTVLQLPRLWLELLAVGGLTTLVLTLLAQGRDLAHIVPTLGLFVMAAFRLMPSVNRLISSVISIGYAVPVVNALHKDLKLSAPELPARLGNDAPALKSEIRIDGITYTYPNASIPSLNNLSINIQKSESIGFFGPSGSGKSTLVDVVLGLLTPDAGLVAVDGQDIQKNLRTWQDQIGYVPQVIYLTDDTFRRNVAFGLPNDQIDDAAVNRAIKAAQLEEFVDGLPEGLETVVGERGVRLSGGQRQRIGIARALYHDPAVLVLDEATSALDVATEREVMQAVTALQGSKTILIVAHRLSTLECCDRLYMLEHGRVAAEGTPAGMLPGLRESAADAKNEK